MSRRTGREIAFKMLFQIDVGKNNYDMAKLTLDEAVTENKLDKEDEDFIVRIVNGVVDNQEILDEFISKYSQGWSLSRINAMDRNIIRIALFEICKCNDIPLNVSIDEAIEIAKIYGTPDSPGFVNAILDNIHKEPELLKDKKRS